MALNKGIGNISCSILPNSVRARLSGNLSYTPVTPISSTAGSEGWVYVETPATSSSTNLITTSHDYFGTSIAVANDDLVRWICVEHTGTTDGFTKTTEGIVIGLNVAAAFDTPGMIFLAPGEIISLKVPLTEDIPVNITLEIPTFVSFSNS